MSFKVGANAFMVCSGLGHRQEVEITSDLFFGRLKTFFLRDYVLQVRLEVTNARSSHTAALILLLVSIWMN